MLKNIYSLIIKEITQLLRNPKSRTVVIIPPLVQLLLLAHAATLEIKNIDIVIMNEDHGYYSEQFVQKFTGSRYFKKVMLTQKTNIANKMLKTKKTMAIIKIEQNFSKKIHSGEKAKIQILLDGRNSNSAQILAGYIEEVVSQFLLDIGPTNQEIEYTKVAVRHWFNPNLDYIWFTLPSLLGTVLTIMGITISSLSISYEKESGTFEQLLVSPLSSFEILIGKAIPTLIVAMMEGILLFIASITFFKVPFIGSVFYLLLSMALYVISILGIGLFVSIICSTQQQAILGSFVFIAPAMLLSGFATPIENMSKFLQKVSMINPMRYFMAISKGLYLKDISFYNMLPNLLPLVAIGAITIIFSVIIFHYKTS